MIDGNKKEPVVLDFIRTSRISKFTGSGRRVTVKSMTQNVLRDVRVPSL